MAKKKSVSKKKHSEDEKESEQAKERTKKSCFVLMPFSDPISSYYSSIYAPAIDKAGLEPVRADDLSRSSPIVADLWRMIQETDVVLAELTTRNANVFYELGLAHAIGKPAVLVSETLDDVPFDLQSIRVLEYDKDDPTWGPKLCRRITTSIQETLESPVDAVPSMFRRAVDSQAPEQEAILVRLQALEDRERIRTFRRRRIPAKVPPGSVYDEAFAALEQVRYTDDFHDWVRNWFKRGVARSQLEALARQFGASQKQVDTISATIREVLPS